MKYYKGLIHENTLKQGTKKAVCLDIDDGRWSSRRDKKFWLAKSVCIIGDRNECGWHEILIPYWLLRKNNIDYSRILDINFAHDGKLFVDA